MKVYKNFQEMFAHLRGKVEVIKPKEFVPKKAEKEAPKEEKPKKKATKKAKKEN